MDNMDISETAILERLWPTGEDSGICKPLFECFQNGLFCDVVLIADDGKKIPAHRNVLYSASIYFKTMFTTELGESGQSEVRIEWVAGDILHELVKYCYGEEITIGGGNVEAMARASTMLQFTRVQAKCSEVFSAGLSPLNCLGIREFADQHNMVHLEEEARRMALDCFMEVFQSEEFNQLDVNQLAALLKDDGLNVSEEDEVFSALVSWVKHDFNSRHESFPGFLDCVRFQHVKDSFMLEEVNQHCTNFKCSDVFAIIVARRSAEEERESPRSPYSQITRLCGTNSEVKIDRYCPRQNVWTEVKSLDKKLSDFTVIHRSGKFIVIGGRDATKRITNSVKSIDVNTYEVTDLPPLKSNRKCPSAELINDTIYVFGGMSDNVGRVVRTVEKFDFATNKWTEVKPMSIPRYFSAHVVVSDRLFVIGGKDDKKHNVNSVECYDPLTDKWELVAPMQHIRSSATACVSKKIIYVFGGHGAGQVLQSIERYETRENTWTELEFALPVPRFDLTCSLAGGDWIYLAGGVGADYKYKPINSVVKLNVITGEVVKLEDLQRPCDYYPLLKF